MHEEYISIKGEVIVTDKTGHIEPITRKNTSNIEEVLIKENIIDSYKNIIKDQEAEITHIQKEIKNYRTLYKIAKKIGVVSLLGTLIGIFFSLPLIGTTQNEALFAFDLIAGAFTSCSIIVCATQQVMLKMEKTDLESLQVKHTLTKNQLKKELENYNQLTLENEIVPSTTTPKKIDDTKEYQKLQNKMAEFKTVGKNIHLYKKWYQQGVLQKNLVKKYQLIYDINKINLIEGYVTKECNKQLTLKRGCLKIK